MRRIAGAVSATLLALAGVAAPMSSPALAAGAPEGLYGATATGMGVGILIDSTATGGAFYAANAAAPFTEAVVSTGGVGEATASYAYDRNAVTGLYAVGSATSQQNGGPAFPEIPNTAVARYPGTETSRAQPDIAQELGPVTARAGNAVADAAERRAAASSDAASLEAQDGSFRIGAQIARATSEVSDDGVSSDMVTHVENISVAGALTIGAVVSESHASQIAGAMQTRTVFRIIDASVAGVPVTIGTDGIRIADQSDATLMGTPATAARTVSEALASAGVSARALDPITTKTSGARAMVEGLVIHVQQPSTNGVPGETIDLVVGRTAASASFQAPPPPPPPEKPIARVEASRTYTTTTVIGGTTPAVTASSPPAPPPVMLISTRRLPPAPLLFGLWQIATFGWVVIAWWRRQTAGAA